SPAAFAQDDEEIAEGVFDKESWPLQTIHRPLTLAGGMLEIRGDTLTIGIGSGEVFDFGQPIILAPDVFYGVNGQLTVGVTHSNRFGAFAPAGFCVSGEDGGCPKGYNAIGAEAQYALTRGGNVGLAVNGGLSSPRFSPDFALGLTAGATIRVKGGSIAVVLDPSLYLGAIGRDDFPGTDGPSDFVVLPVDIQYQLNTQTMVYLTSGVNGPFDGFGDAYRIPVGIGGTFAINNRADIGGEINIANLGGKPQDPIGRFDERYFIARLAIRI